MHHADLAVLDRRLASARRREHDAALLAKATLPGRRAAASTPRRGALLLVRDAPVAERLFGRLEIDEPHYRDLR